MAKGTRTLAKELGVTRDQVKHIKKEVQNDGKPMSASTVKVAKEKIKRNNAIKEKNASTVEKLSSMKVRSKVRRIDKQDTSSLQALLSDAKERYVANQKIIEQLQAEVDNIDSTIVDNANGSLSSLPQFTTIERFVKLNINLRNQIVQLEEALEITSDEEEDNPFS